MRTLTSKRTISSNNNNSRKTTIDGRTRERSGREMTMVAKSSQEEGVKIINSSKTTSQMMLDRMAKIRTLIGEEIKATRTKTMAIKASPICSAAKEKEIKMVSTTCSHHMSRIRMAMTPTLLEMIDQEEWVSNNLTKTIKTTVKTTDRIVNTITMIARIIKEKTSNTHSKTSGTLSRMTISSVACQVNNSLN